MKHPLKILHLEDLPSDAELVARSLKKGGIDGEIFLVSDRPAFMKALKTFSPDIIISDHSLPSLDSHEALELIKEMGIRVPIILVTATVSEEYAANMIKEGASDYILKDRLQRLPNAVNAALSKHKLEQEQKQAVESLGASERKYKLLFEKNPMPMWMVSKSTLDIIAVNDAAISFYGYTKEEFLKLKTTDLRSKKEVAKFNSSVKVPDQENTGTWQHVKKDGTIKIVEVIAHEIMYEDLPVILILANDVTEKLEAEAELADERRAQQKRMQETSIRAQEKERGEIGKELHDNINQILAASKLYIDHAMKMGAEATQLPSLQKSQEHILLAIQEIRKLSHSLIAPSLGDISLYEAIEKLISEIEPTSTLKIKLIAPTLNETLLDNDIKLMFYRILQEQISNILKHAEAKNATVQFIMSTTNLHLSVRDDGRGFDSSTKARGIGLQNIKTRVEFYDGVMQIDSSPGKGCILDITVPICRKEKLAIA